MLLCAMAFLVLLILTTEMPEGITGTAHPSYPKMFMGAEKGEGQAEVLGLLPLLLLIVMLGFFGTLIHLGIPLKRRGVLSRLVVGIATGLQIGLVAALWYVYREASFKGWAPMAGSFPMPTAIFLYFLYPVFGLFVVAYIVKFRTLVYPPDSETAYKALVAEMKNVPVAER